jgi:hypothetical protein
MNTPTFRAFIIACALAVAAHWSQAQTTPPMKPGLWQIHVESDMDGKKETDVSERMKNMSFEARQKMEAAMKEHGMDSGDMSRRKVCYSREMLDRGHWAEQPGVCKTDYSTRSASSWKWHSSCKQISYEGDGEATFSNSENYVVKSIGVITSGAKTHTTQSTITAKWLGSDCGDIKPVDPKQ